VVASLVSRLLIFTQIELLLAVPQCAAQRPDLLAVSWLLRCTAPSCYVLLRAVLCCIQQRSPLLALLTFSVLTSLLPREAGCLPLKR
jgi:hypothetical protein